MKRPLKTVVKLVLAGAQYSLMQRLKIDVTRTDANATASILQKRESVSKKQVTTMTYTDSMLVSHPTPRRFRFL